MNATELQPILIWYQINSQIDADLTLCKLKVNDGLVNFPLQPTNNVWL